MNQQEEHELNGYHTLLALQGHWGVWTLESEVLTWAPGSYFPGVQLGPIDYAYIHQTDEPWLAGELVHVELERDWSALRRIDIEVQEVVQGWEQFDLAMLDQFVRRDMMYGGMLVSDIAQLTNRRHVIETLNGLVAEGSLHDLGRPFCLTDDDPYLEVLEAFLGVPQGHLSAMVETGRLDEL